ncbi:hypothetical protein L6164_032146 [Bauhinia variegata]|uniref:Uncharacterized protein n=1 Tax=Bauhinia variegata TaxID=167791 RepID=A0ACB9KMR1_BAUVA|nr:hypothetical protein L6164_032146 [Bauhinia variegata]
MDPELRSVVPGAKAMMEAGHFEPVHASLNDDECTTTMAVVSLVPLSFLGFLLNLASQVAAQPRYVKCVEERGNFTTTSTFKTNLDTLLANLTSSTQINYGFYNLSYGQNPDEVSVIGLCRGDLEPDVCRSCLNEARSFLPQNCSNNKEAIVFYDTCMLRYSNRAILGVMEDSPWYYFWEGNNVTDVNQYKADLNKLLGELGSKAASGDSRLKFATGNVAGPNFQNIYALVQCTPDLSAQICRNCLDMAFSEIYKCCDRKGAVGIGRPSCTVRYRNSIFYETAVPDVTTPPASTTITQGKSNRLRLVIAIVVPVVSFITLVIFVSIYLRVRKSKKYIEAEVDGEIISVEQLQFNYDTIKDATNDFSDENKVGQGGYGPVYKGRLSDGREIAVKRLSMNSSQGDAEFKNEVMLVAKLQHRNLVRLLGFCLERKERLLIYEYVPNKSLDKFIFDPTKNAEIDFGIAKQVVMDQTHESTNTIVGTYGYMAPEYAMHGQFSSKSDVYSFGVLILEIVSGYKINNPIGQNEEYLISFVWKNWRKGTALNIVDPNLIGGSTNEVIRCIHIGLLCVQDNVADRPTMASVVLMLNSSTTTLAIPSEPAFFINTGNLSALQSEEYNSESAGKNEPVQALKTEASISDLYPR